MCILDCIGMDCYETFFLLDTLALGALVGIMGGSLGFPSEDRVGRTRAVQMLKWYRDAVL